jgi:lipid II:glycine glycyltransferase (peptidoglycan interpeptide bridge formation enzyme)
MATGAPSDGAAPVIAARPLATESDLADWDELVVDVAGGHVFQSRAWAAHRATRGWRPIFWATDDGGRVLSLSRRWPGLPGAGAYLPRGPVPVPGSDLATRLIAVTEGLAGTGADVVAADPEVAAADSAYLERIGRVGFHAIDEIQPSRHRLALPLPADGDEAAAFGAIAKSTRQRIRGAERAGLTVICHDGRTDAAGGDGFGRPSEPVAATLDRFATMLGATGDRRGFSFERARFLDWWTAAHAAGHLIVLEARWEDQPVAGLLLYRHGRRLSTAHSADRAETRREHPGALHLLRWRALQLALREGRTELDLGGVDVAGARRPPLEGEPMWGLYQHKLSFGAAWIEQVGAQERVLNAWRYGLGRVSGRLAAVAGRRR